MFTVVLLDGAHYFQKILEIAIREIRNDAEFIVDPARPPSSIDLVVLSVFSNAHQGAAYRNVRKIVIGGEPQPMGGFYRRVLLAIDCKRIAEPCPNHMQKLYWPFYALSFGERRQNTPRDLILSSPVSPPPERRDKFCAFLYRNPEPNRVRFFDKLSAQYQQVDGLGAVRHNVPGMQPDRFVYDLNQTYNDLAVQKYRSYRFVLCFENTRCPGYSTEKITSAMLAGAIPIYWGAPDIDQHFNPKSFIDVAKFATFEDAIRKIAEIDRDPRKYQEMLREPWLSGNRLTRYFDFKNYAKSSIERALVAPMPSARRIVQASIGAAGRRRRRVVVRRNHRQGTKRKRIVRLKRRR